MPARHLILAATALLVACGGAAGPETAPATRAARPAIIAGRAEIPTTWTRQSNPVVAPKAMVVSAHPLASAAGVEVLRQGGNAIDAAVAVGFALAVVLPDAGNIGGGGFIMYREATGRVRALDYRETAPGGASRDMYLDSAGNLSDKSVTGHLAAGVPGSVAGLYEAWQKHGKLKWSEVVAPAIRLAQGHRLDAARASDIEDDAERLGKFPGSRHQFLVNGHAPAVGTT